MRIDLPFLNPVRCAAHEDCVTVCPTDCLQMQAGRPWLARPADCIACSLCAAVCPTGAITMKSWAA
jgi:NAD-dependent dihydropyrimidine dehydrogenase PreA subunit